MPVSLISRSSQFAHGNDAYRYCHDIIADFSTNTWYKGPHPELDSFLKANMSCIANYPELQCESLTAALADNHHVAEDQVLVCNGTAEAIFYIAQGFANAGSRIITPTFSEYEHACQVYNHQISYCGAGFLSDGMNTPEGLFWLCNPNNPTGEVFSKELLLDLIKNNPQTTFVIDEAYADFCIEDISMVPYIGRFKNLLILKSMTKNYCLPGLRLGYVLGHQAVVSRLSIYRPPWSVNSLALKAGEFALRQPIIDELELLTYLSLSKTFRTEISAIPGIEVYPSSTGYFLVKTPMPAAELKQLLVEKYGLLVRDASNFRTLCEYHIRLATLSREKNDRLITAFKSIFQ
ncbi:pyridoxal phosphate-dependent class II aminotransferase [Carboxylicivirga mesophila]|uniref:Pyridoxal phosphate-dependent class II aminotransferase n=1 Tax=Carboxylicivirga mesophila TaxID=1166478 RepID=A0ABS5KDL4_9BACT|nr:aminotransferase class I/II-fold pyridoxal phosphate-dependent enzyme [Carboxylicivirga mesophila]MBS2212967.1 pyridoxal phosphate-dependent class II aminotransferase [Carboxylicivirga mesophila]